VIHIAEAAVGAAFAVVLIAWWAVLLFDV